MVQIIFIIDLSRRMFLFLGCILLMLFTPWMRFSHLNWYGKSLSSEKSLFLGWHWQSVPINKCRQLQIFVKFFYRLDKKFSLARFFFLEPMKIQSRQLWTLIRLYPNTSLDKEKLPFGPIQTDADGISVHLVSCCVFCSVVVLPMPPQK